MKLYVKYLGVTLQSNLKFNQHVANVIKKAKDVTSKLWSLIKPGSKLHQNNKLLMYKLYVRSVLTYNIQIWDDISNGSKQKLQVYQNRCIRTALNLRPHPVTYKQIPTNTIHEMSRIPKITEFASKIKENFVQKCRQHVNELVVSLFVPENN